MEGGAEGRKVLVVALHIYNSITLHHLGLRGEGVRVEGEEVGGGEMICGCVRCVPERRHLCSPGGHTVLAPGLSWSSPAGRECKSTCLQHFHQPRHKHMIIMVNM